MRVQHMYCSMRDRDIRVAITDAPLHDAQATIPDAELVCLEVGEPCGGTVCPLFAVPVESLRFRLAHDGFDTSMLRHLHASCPGCDRDADLLALDRSHVYCVECGTVSAWRPIPDDAPTFED